MTQGKYRTNPELPFGLGMEGSGIVRSVGTKVSKVKEGDEITFGALGKGAFTELICVNENSVEIKPSNLSFEQAAAFQPAYLTAYVSLVRRGELVKGENLLVHGATGGVGMAAVQLGKYLGAKVVTAGTSEEKLKETINWGADHTVITHKGDKSSLEMKSKSLLEVLALMSFMIQLVAMCLITQSGALTGEVEY